MVNVNDKISQTKSCYLYFEQDLPGESLCSRFVVIRGAPDQGPSSWRTSSGFSFSTQSVLFLCPLANSVISVMWFDILVCDVISCNLEDRLPQIFDKKTVITTHSDCLCDSACVQSFERVGQRWLINHEMKKTRLVGNGATGSVCKAYRPHINSCGEHVP